MAWTETDRAALEQAIGHAFSEPRHLERALTHSTVRHEANGTFSGDNEELEFLGDAVLGLVVSEALLHTFPEWTAGKLSQCKARLVSAPLLHQAARGIQLGNYVQLGKGEEKTGGREKETVLADAYEAVVAAVYLDGGLEPAAAFVRRTLLEEALHDDTFLRGVADHKSLLQEFLQARGQRPAEYRVVEESGPDHCKTFMVEVLVQGESVARSSGSSKKKAEQNAARVALEGLRGGGACARE
jgi:ribonuclease-3